MSFSKFPNEIDFFKRKLNYSRTSNLVIDEEITIDDQKEWKLSHDNLMNRNGIEVWTSVNKTGEKITDFTLSQNTNKKWEYYLVFNESVPNGTYYVTYHSKGDEIDADDLHKIEDAIVSTQLNLKEDVMTLLTQKVSKVNGISPDENGNVVIGTGGSGEWIDHTHPISEVSGLETILDNKAAYDHTHSEATTTVSGFMGHLDKTKLNGIEANANNYTHPETHPASMITTDTDRRFVSDTQISQWNSIHSIVEARTTDPSNPEVGRMWLRSDL